MKQVISIRNIKLTSLNQKYTKHRYTGNLILTKAYRELRDLIRLYAVKGFVAPPYSLIIKVETCLDYDNILKPIGDGLQAAGIIDDDKNIIETHIYKKPIKRGSLGSLKVMIGTLENEHIQKTREK